MRKKQMTVGLGILVNDANQILVSLRNDPKHPSTHMKWEIPGGKVEFGESVEDAVVREMKEELGVHVTLFGHAPIILSHVWHFPEVDLHVILVGLLCKTTGKIKANNEEIADFMWVDAEEIKKHETLPTCNSFVKRAIEQLNKP